MSDPERTFVKRLADGSVAAWCGGWEAHFPTDGSKPILTTGAPPDPPPTEPVDGVRVGNVGSAPSVRLERWTVVFSGDPPAIKDMAVRPRSRSDRLKMFRLSGRRP